MVLRLEPMSSFAPAAVMVYTDLETLQGLDKPTDYGSGIEYADGIFNSLFLNSAMGLQIGMWLNGTYGCNLINEGQKDHQIRKLSNYLKSCSAGVVFMRIGYGKLAQNISCWWTKYFDNCTTFHQKIAHFSKNLTTLSLGIQIGPRHMF